MRIAVIDDDPFLRQGWARELGKECAVIAFDGPSSFWQAVDLEPRLLDSLDVILLDFYFDGTPRTGAEIAQDIRAKSSCPIIACTSTELSENEACLFSGIIDKEPQPLLAVARSLVAGWSR